jgi:tight adherence protein C
VDPLVAAAAAFAGLAFIGVGVGAWFLAHPYATPKDRLRTMGTAADKIKPQASPEDPILRRKQEVPTLLRRVVALAEPSKPEDISLMRQEMLQAGFKSPNALEVYLMARVLLALSLPVLVGLLLTNTQVAVLAMALLAAATLGYYLPWIVVTQQAQRRKQNISRAVPDGLDLLVSCTEAGLALDSSFDRVADNLHGAAPELAQELHTVTVEVAAGVSRQEALRRLEQRTGVPELGSLVNVLIQADRLGTPVAQALRVYASTTRTRRMLSAEEKAAAISPKLTVAMVLFLLPALFVVILGPAIVNIIVDVLPSLVAP